MFVNISTEMQHVVERFTRTNAYTLKWEITVDDPGAWSKPWTAMTPLGLSKDAIFEYVCHEGNYGMEGILAGARSEENSAEAAVETSRPK